VLRGKTRVTFQDRLKPGIRQLREWIRAGVVGRILLVDARVKWYRPPQYLRRLTMAWNDGA